jgi:hypothetical protein
LTLSRSRIPRRTPPRRLCSCCEQIFQYLHLPKLLF